MTSPEIGSTVTCAETKKQFVVSTDGFTFNYATNRGGKIFSDEGVDIRERRELLDRTKSFFCYLAGDGKTVGGWKGNILGIVTSERTSRTGFYGSELTHIRVEDVHGGLWYGKGAGRGICVTLNPARHPQK